MKKISQVAFCATLAGGLLAIPRQAHAAHWVLTYKIDGQNRYAPQGVPGGQVVEEPWSTNYPGNPSTGEISSSQSSNYDISFYHYSARIDAYPSSSGGPQRNYPGFTSKIDGEITAILTWTMDAGETVLPSAPAYVSIKVTAYSIAKYGGQDSGSKVEATIGKTGQGVTENLTNEYAASQAYYMPPHWQHSKHVTGNYRLIKAVPQGETKVEIKFPLKAQVESHAGTTPSSLIGQHDLHAQLKARPESMFVSISSSLEPSYYKSTEPPYTSPGQPVPTPMPNTDPPAWRVPCQRNPQGEMTVHSAPIWTVLSSGYGSVSRAWFGHGSFTANQSGMDNPTYTWDIQGGSFVGDVLAPHYPQYGSGGASVDIGPSSTSTTYATYTGGMTLGGNKNDGPSTKTTTVKVTAEDPSIMLEDTYTVQWHSPYENKQHKGHKSKNFFKVIAPSECTTAGQGRPANQSHSAKFSYQENSAIGDWAELFGVISDAVSVAANGVEPPPLSVLGALLGVVAGDVQERLDTDPVVCVNSESSFNEAQALSAIPVEAGGQVLAPAGYTWQQTEMTEPLVIVKYDTDYYKVDAYNSSGYSGTVNKAKRIPKEIVGSGRYVTVFPGGGGSSQ